MARHFIQSQAVLLVSALWCAVLAGLIYTIGERKLVFDFLLPFGALFFFLLCLYAMATSQKALTRKIFPLTRLFFSAFACFVVTLFGYYRKIDSNFYPGDIYAILQSNVSESTSYMLAQLSSASILVPAAGAFAFSLVLTFAGTSLEKQSLFLRTRFVKKYTLPVCAVCAVVCFFATNPVYMALGSFSQYHKDLRAFNDVFSSLSGGETVQSSKKEQGELFVLVIGESENRDAMGAHTGPLDNTPWRSSLAKDSNWSVFANAYSYHTHTVPALCQALTDGRALTGLTFPKGPNIMSVSRQAGINTTWLSNQASMGPWDNPVAAMAYLADTTRYTRTHQSFSLTGPEPDEVLLPLLHNALQKMDFAKNNLLIIHLMGNHWPYSARVPKDYNAQYFMDTWAIGKLAKDKEHALLYNEYLTSVGHTDAVLQKMFAEIEAYAEKPVVMMYFSDHADDNFSKDRAHNLNNFTWSMTRIPFYIWASPEYQRRHPDRVAQLARHKDSIFTNDLVFDAYLGLFGIETPSYKAEFDISNPAYSVPLDIAKIVENRMIKEDPELQLQQSLHAPGGEILVAHRANTVFKTRQLQQRGVQAFEVDLYYDKETQQLMLGHDADSMAGISLPDYLDKIEKGYAFLWLDCKNLTAENAQAFYAALTALESKYTLRSRVLVESKTAEGLAVFAANDWETSAYLAWNKLADGNVPKSREALEALAAEVAEKLVEYGIGGISYDMEADAWVQGSMRPFFPETTRYYGWDQAGELTDVALGKKLTKYPHLSRLLVRFSSPFDL